MIRANQRPLAREPLNKIKLLDKVTLKTIPNISAYNYELVKHLEDEAK